MRALIAAFAIASLGIPVRADYREVTKVTVAGQEQVIRRYQQGDRSRYEWDDAGRGSEVGNPRVVIMDSRNHHLYQLDPGSRKYTELNGLSADWIVKLASLISRPPRIKDSGKTVQLYQETIDTGERKWMLGRTAEHFILRTRRVAPPGSCEPSHEETKDSWYVPVAQTPVPSIRASFTATVSGQVGCRDVVVRHADRLPSGIAVLEVSDNSRREIVELSESRLDPSLFEVPAHFQKQEQMTATERMRWDWSRLERAIQTWFD